MARQNIGTRYIVEHDENHVYLVYKSVYRLHGESNGQPKIATGDFSVQKDRNGRSWDLTLSNLRAGYA